MPEPYFMEDGQWTTIYPASDPTVKFYEKEISPPGFDGGGGINTTGHRNSVWRTKAHKSLVEMTEFTVTVAYAPAHMNRIWALINVTQLWEVNYPTGEVLTFYAFLDKFIPDPHREGEQPTAKMTFVPTNEDVQQNEQDYSIQV